MWFAILGPLLVHDGKAPVEVPKGRQRVLLAALLLRARNTVSADVLAELVWDGAPPPGAEITLRSHVLRLRRVLGPRAGPRLVTRHPGYLLQAVDDEVDLLRFRGLCRDGGAALREEAWDRADGLLGEALGLWRGTPLADIPSEQLLREETPSLEALRLQAEEWRTDAALHLGRHDELIPGLQALAAQHPLRERFHGQLMFALYRCGRQAEALAAYQSARDILVGELGTEPGPDLRELHQRILSADPALALANAPSPGVKSTQTAVPRELPAAVRHFTGRADELAALTRMLDQSGEQAPEALVISAIGGTAGVGKTALAVHWAHQAAGRFPDGQLYVNLRGYDPAQPMPTTDALAAFLRSLGVPGQDIPSEADHRAARYRSLLAGKRMLVVLDNAGSADQVRPLLPGTPACTVLVTSRDTLAGLVARDGAARLDLDVLPLEEAVALLRTLIGERVDAEPGSAAELADRCCRLPLALRVAAELAATRPAASLAVLAGELADLRTRLDMLDVGGDPRTQVRAVFSWSYRHLDADAARTFRLLGLHPGADLDSYAAAALTGTTLSQANNVLHLLARAHLIQPDGSARYGLHDLLRAYAREMAAADSADEKRAAMIHLFDYYLYTVAAAIDTLYPGDRHRRPRIPVADTPIPMVISVAASTAWLDAELATLVAVTAYTAEQGWTSHATRLAAILFRYLQTAGHYAEAIVIYTYAARVARHIGDRIAEADALNALGMVDWRQGRYEQATNRLEQSVALYRQACDRTGQARALGNLGIVEGRMGRYNQATSHHEQALYLYGETGNLLGQRITLNNLRVIQLALGRCEQAADYLHQAFSLYRELDDPEGKANALTNLGAVEVMRGHYDQAARYLRHALSLFRERGDRWGEARTLDEFGTLHLRQGRYEQAAECLRQAVSMHRQMGDLPGQAIALNGLGDVLLSTGHPEQAHAQHTAALELASQAGSKMDEAQAHDGLANVYHATGKNELARDHWQQALTIYIALGVPEATRISTKLNNLNHVAP